MRAGLAASICLLTLVVWLSTGFGSLPAQEQPGAAAQPQPLTDSSALTPDPRVVVEEVPTFAQRVDAWFGRYLVSYLEAVLFYRFGATQETYVLADHVEDYIRPVGSQDDFIKIASGPTQFERISPQQVRELHGKKRLVAGPDDKPIRLGKLFGKDVEFVRLAIDTRSKYVLDEEAGVYRRQWAPEPWVGPAPKELTPGDIERLAALNRLVGAGQPSAGGKPYLQTGKAGGAPLVVLWLLFGALFFTLRMGFINFRAFRHAVKLTKGDYDDPSHPGEVSHFQALSSALSATVGLGNIAGVAIAVMIGGPGAIFWLIVAGLLGMSSKFSECSLGMLYRKHLPDGTVSGGPMHYLKDGLAELGLKPLGAVLAVIFAIMCIGGSFGGGCAFQIGQSLGAIKRQVPFFEAYPWVYGLIMAFLTGIVIIGGIRRIAAVAEKIVPFMCGLYVLACLVIIFTNYDRILPGLMTILSGAFQPHAAYGGFLGVLVTGIQRASFSNEAGVGSASIAHSAAKTDIPIREGLVALLEPFIDTVVVCTMTGLVIVITGVYDQGNPAFADYIIDRDGAGLTSAAFETEVRWFPWLLLATVVLFAYSTVISWSYYGERCATRLLGPRASLPYKVLFLVFVVLGSIVTRGNILNFSDLMILSMAFPNILGVILLSGKVKKALDDYWLRYKGGEFKPRR
jgi:AGCS family alanine or glycine:cation symporter